MSTTTQLPQVTPGTPAKEWANDTEARLGTTSTTAAPMTATDPSVPRTFASTAPPPVTTTTNTVPHAPTDAPTTTAGPTTPGMPGAYRSESYTSAGQDAGSRIITTAQEQLGALAQTAAQYLPQSVKETVAPYLPAGTSVTSKASEHDVTHQTSYPSTELMGAGSHEHVGGVGALPGRVTESGVADAEKLDHTVAPGPTMSERAANLLPQGVKNVAASYLPASVGGLVSASEHDSRHKMSMPSTELTGAGSHEHIGGVGALPGNVSEEGVARVPDEQNTDTSATAAGKAMYAREAAVGTAAAAAGYVSRGVDQAKATATGIPAGTSMPTSEKEGIASREHVSGAGPLPGKVGEAGVAVLPDERNRTAVAPRGESLSTHDDQKTSSTATPMQTKDKAPATGDVKSASKGLPNKGDGYGEGYHPAELHPPNADYSNVKVEGGEPKGTAGEKSSEGTAGQDSHPGGTQGRQTTSADTDDVTKEAKYAAQNADSATGSPSSPTHKPKLMDKIKGEFKVIAGKMSGNRDKVAEGHNLKSGDSPQ